MSTLPPDFSLSRRPFLSTPSTPRNPQVRTRSWLVLYHIMSSIKRFSKVPKTLTIGTSRSNSYFFGRELLSKWKTHKWNWFISVDFILRCEICTQSDLFSVKKLFIAPMITIEFVISQYQCIVWLSQEYLWSFGWKILIWTAVAH